MSHEVLTAELPTALTGEETVAQYEALRAQLAVILGEQATATYFHGTNYPLKIGEQITPGGQAIPGENGMLHASASAHEDGAWFHAQSKETLEGGRGRVYKVVPSDGMPAQRLGPQHGEVNSPAFTVVDQIDVMPGRQGTLPDVNWNKDTPYSHQNHPEDPLPQFYDDWKEPERPSPDEVPLPGMGQEYVDAERVRMRIATGRPEM